MARCCFCSPAVAVFRVFFGVAIQRVEKKQGPRNSLDAVRRAGVTIWGWAGGIAPLAFAAAVDRFGADGAMHLCVALSAPLLAAAFGLNLLVARSGSA